MLSRSLAHEGFRRHGETHVAGAVDEFEDGGGCLVVVAVEGLDVQDAGVAAGTVEISFTEGAEEFGEVDEGVLICILR